MREEAAGQPLDPLTFPLHGSRLIEASAGTGKTYTIAALYLRLVLNHGGDAAYGAPLTPPQILVVTFTDAATRELRDRIRRRLAGAAAAFRDPARSDPADTFLQGLLADYPDAEARARCARVLDLAAEWMDEAAVATIHAWSYRMLREHAFDSGSLFTQDLESDQSELLAEAVRDYWRSFVYPLAPAELRLFQGAVGAADPQALRRSVAPLIGTEAASAADDDPLLKPEGLAQRLRCWRDSLEALKAPWRDDREAVEAQFRQLRDQVLNGSKYRNPEQLLERMGAWAEDPALPVPLTGDGKPDAGLLERMSASGLAHPERRKRGRELPAQLHPAFHALDGYTDAAGPEAEILQAAARWIGRRFRAEQRRRGQLGFQDLLTRLRDALHGEGGTRLAATIRRQFPVALIDEFQDTDPVQYQLFDAVYRVAESDPALGLFLIGDPKQAIYGFRGADIHSYLRAREATQGRHYTLPRNFRSTQRLVSAVNRLFGQAEDRWPHGAFAFPGSDPGGLPFQPVAAEGRGETLEVDGEEPPALTLWCHDPGEAVPKGRYLATYAGACAERMVQLLNAGAAEEAGFRDADGDLAALRPRDLAVLVRDRHEARAIQEALDARGVRSVYLSDSDSVLNTAEADELVRWLRACAEPTDERLVRAALATPTLGLALGELDRLMTDELAWEQRLEQFTGYRRIWRRRGVLAMLHRLLHDFHVPQRLLAAEDSRGERALTNLLHLGELLQKAAREHDGEQALIRYLVTQREQAQQGGDDQILRLESDADLVKVATVHKAKGLQYPLVFLPFPCTFKQVTGKRAPLRVPEADGTWRWCFRPGPEAVERADAERLAEDLRLLYVAVTRAQYACWVGMAPITLGNSKRSCLGKSAAGYLLTGPEGAAPGGLRAALGEAAGETAPIAVAARPEPRGERFRSGGLAPPLGQPCRPQRPAADAWWIASYSALIRHDPAAGALPAPGTPAEEVIREAAEEAAEAGAGASGWHAFPRGPGPGTFLHGLLEWAAAELGLATAGAQPARLDEEIARRCRRRGWSDWIPVLQGWLRALLRAELVLPGAETPLVLGGLADYRAELEFLIEARPLEAGRIDAAVREQLLPGAQRPAAAPAQINGMLKGFVDLVCCHEGRYYVADYKSNWLGPDEGAYTPERLEAAVLERRYDLQLTIYTLALHRLLRARLPDYDYDRHVGGGLYIFLRGVEAPGQGAFYARPPRALIETLDGWLRTGPDRQGAT